MGMKPIFIARIKINSESYYITCVNVKKKKTLKFGSYDSRIYRAMMWINELQLSYANWSPWTSLIVPEMQTRELTYSRILTWSM